MFRNYSIYLVEPNAPQFNLVGRLFTLVGKLFNLVGKVFNLVGPVF